MRHACVLLIVGLVGAAAGMPIAARTRAQDAASQQNSSQDSSVAEAARRNRDKKKNPPSAPKTTKVLTDDNFERKNSPTGQEGLDVGGSPTLETTPPSAKAVAAAEAADEAPQREANEAAELDAKTAKLKLEITEAENGLDFAQRQLALDQDSYFSKTDYARNTAGKAKLDAEKQGISDRQQKIAGLKSQLAALEEAKGRAKTDRSPAPQPGQTQAPPQR